MSRPPMLPAEDPIRRLPVLMLEVCDRCGCRCVMCDLWKPRDNLDEGHLDLELLAGWLPGWHALGVGRVGLTGGEPLLHRRLDRLLEILHDDGFGLTLMTAGSGLGRYSEAVARSCDSVVVSLDGPEQVHDGVRRSSGSFAQLRAGVAELRRRAPASLRITARCTVQRANIGTLVQTTAAARAMELDGISFLPVDQASTAFGRTDADGPKNSNRTLWPTGDDLRTLEAEIDELAGCAAGFVAEDRDQLVQRVLGHFRAEAGLADHRSRPCNAPWVSAVIQTDGTVRPCFFHAPIGRLEPGEAIGEVLNRKAARAFRDRLNIAENPVCRRCVCPLALRAGEEPR